MAIAEAVMLNQAKKKLIRLRSASFDPTRDGSLKITHFAVGDGNGAFYTPSADMEDLKRAVPITEGVYTKAIESCALASDGYSYIYTCRLLETECVGYSLREIGLIDSDGLLLCIKAFEAKQKDGDREMIFRLSDTF